MSVSAQLVKELREKTNAGMMDCKKALTETNGNFEAALDWLRAKGLSAAAKKADRVAAEGLVALAASGHTAALIEINSETDFVARNAQFQDLVSSVSELALQAIDIDQLRAMSYSSGRSVEEEVKENVATIGENLTLRRMRSVKVAQGVVGTYVHNAVAPNMGKIAVAVGLESKTSNLDGLAALGKSLAMHIAASRPQALIEADIPEHIVERERAICLEKAQSSGKPENIIQGMVEGGVRKFFQENVLLNQLYIMDGKTKISDVLKNAAADLGAEVTISSFARFELGEGIEKVESNFEHEVNAIAGKK